MYSFLLKSSVRVVSFSATTRNRRKGLLLYTHQMTQANIERVVRIDQVCRCNIYRESQIAPRLIPCRELERAAKHAAKEIERSSAGLEILAICDFHRPRWSPLDHVTNERQDAQSEPFCGSVCAARWHISEKRPRRGLWRELYLQRRRAPLYTRRSSAPRKEEKTRVAAEASWC